MLAPLQVQLLTVVRLVFDAYFMNEAPPLGSHWSNRTIEGSVLAPSMNSARDSFPSVFLSICLNILSVLFSGVDSSSGIFITEPTILYMAWNGQTKRELVIRL